MDVKDLLPEEASSCNRVTVLQLVKIKATKINISEYSNELISNGEDKVKKEKTETS